MHYAWGCFYSHPVLTTRTAALVGTRSEKLISHQIEHAPRKQCIVCDTYTTSVAVYQPDVGDSFEFGLLNNFYEAKVFI